MNDEIIVDVDVDYIVSCVRKEYNSDHKRGTSVQIMSYSKYIDHNKNWISFKISKDQADFLKSEMLQYNLILNIEKLQSVILDKDFLLQDQSSQIYDATMVNIADYIIELEKEEDEIPINE